MLDSIILVDCLVFAVSFATLYILRIYLTGNKVFAGADDFYHLLISKSIRMNKWAYPSSLKNVTFDEGDKKYDYLAYPPLLHYLTAIFPLKTHLALSKVLNLFVLSLLASLAASLAYSFNLSVSIALIAGFITIFNLAVFEMAVAFSPRPLGLLFYSFLMLTAILYPPGFATVLIVMVLSSLIILTHKFAVQVLIFTFVPYTVLFNEVSLLVGLLLGFLLSVILARGHCLKILREHVSWLYFYSHFCVSGNYKNKLKRILTRNIWYITVIVVLFIVLFQHNLFFVTDYLTKLFFWAFALLAIALLTSLPRFAFLGENYRYVDYSIVPVGVISTLLLSSLNIYAVSTFAMLFLTSTIILSKYKNHIYQTRSLVDSSDVSSYHSLHGSNFCNLLVFPPNRTLEVNFFTGLSVIHPVRMKVSETVEEHIKRLLHDYDIRYVVRFEGPQPFNKFSILAKLVTMKTIIAYKNFEILELSPKEKTA